MEEFVQDVNSQIWGVIWKEYDTVLSLKAESLKPDKKKSLLKLDKWYQNELPKAISSREDRHVTHSELCDLMKWKLTRGKFRPRLTEMVQTNTPDEVLEASTKAFQALPDTAAAVQALTVLKAIGPATASAVLAAGAPKHVAFMADESMAALPGLQPLKYDLSQFKAYMKAINSVVKKLNKQDDLKSWTPHKVELTLWTYQMAKKLRPEILDTAQESLKLTLNSSENIESPLKMTKVSNAEPPLKKAKVSKSEPPLKKAKVSKSEPPPKKAKVSDNEPPLKKPKVSDNEPPLKKAKVSEPPRKKSRV